MMNSCHKTVTLRCVKVGGGKDQGPATEVTHLQFKKFYTELISLFVTRLCEFSNPQFTWNKPEGLCSL